ncbi:hypothetical protein GCM10022221_63780 [Actinocorallia aurea]
MHPAEPVIVGTDGSAIAAKAVRWAARDAALRGRGLLIVRAWNPWDPWPSELPRREPGDDAQEPDIVLRAARVIAEAEAGDPEIRTQPVDGPTIPALRALSQQGRLLVLGHRGVGRVEGLLMLGTTSLGVACHTALLFDQPLAALTEESTEVDLMVVGPSRRSDLKPHLGSVSSGLLHHAACPVAVVTH